MSAEQLILMILCIVVLVQHRVDGLLGARVDLLSARVNHIWELLTSAGDDEDDEPGLAS